VTVSLYLRLKLSIAVFGIIMKQTGRVRVSIDYLSTKEEPGNQYFSRLLQVTVGYGQKNVISTATNQFVFTPNQHTSRYHAEYGA
jgi:hypothetical protein